MYSHCHAYKIILISVICEEFGIDISRKVGRKSEISSDRKEMFLLASLWNLELLFHLKYALLYDLPSDIIVTEVAYLSNKSIKGHFFVPSFTQFLREFFLHLNNQYFHLTENSDVISYLSH